MMKCKELWVVLGITILIVFFVACKSKIVDTPVENASVLVQLHNDNSIILVEKQFVQYALLQEKIVSRPMNIYLFAFDPTKVSDTTLVKLLKQSSLIKEAQTNKDVTSRRN